jgi:hypothetical protein
MYVAATQPAEIPRALGSVAAASPRKASLDCTDRSRRVIAQEAHLADGQPRLSPSYS